MIIICTISVKNNYKYFMTNLLGKIILVMDINDIAFHFFNILIFN